MRLNAVKILGISITINSKKEILEEIQKYLLRTQNSVTRTQKNLIIFTPNAEQIILAHKNPEFQKILNRADIMLPDSVGVIWAGRVLTKNGPNKPIPGVEFIEDLAKLAANRHVPIGLIGGKGKIAIKALECLQQKYSALTGWSEEETVVEKIAQRIIETKARIVFVGLGAPKQEFFIERFSHELFTMNYSHPVVFMAVGGSFDIIGGRLPRAPRFLRGLGLEWLWRLMLEPWRVFRQLALVEFVWRVILEKLFVSNDVNSR